MVIDSSDCDFYSQQLARMEISTTINMDGPLAIRTAVDEQPQRSSLPVLVMEAVGLTKVIARYSGAAELAMRRLHHQLATGIIQMRNGQQIRNSGFTSSMVRVHDAGHVQSAWGTPGNKRVPEGSNL